MKRIQSSDLPLSFFEVPEGREFDVVRRIIADVRALGDDALRSYTRQFDGVELMSFRLDAQEIGDARRAIDRRLASDMERAASRIEKFARKQLEGLQDFTVEMESGVMAGQRVVPLERVGLYVPGGRYPLISSVLMGAVPAKVAGVKEIALFSPPSSRGNIGSEILAAAAIAGVGEVYRVGGAQAIAAMAYGTESIKPVDKIVGPGNVFVNTAKKEVFGKVGVDFIAGPTEIMIIADGFSDPVLVAADLIAQAEHDIEARPVLLTNSEKLAEDVERELETQLKALKSEETARRSLQENGAVILFSQPAEAVGIANRRAPEHLQLCVNDPEAFLPDLRNYGSLFIGEYTSETLGDYSSGLNHILPTNRASRYTGGLSVRDFVKIQTVLEVGPEGLRQIGPVAASLARAEGLFGHEAAVTLRLDRLKG